jgi:hypothetical protein
MAPRWPCRNSRTTSDPEDIARATSSGYMQTVHSRRPTQVPLSLPHSGAHPAPCHQVRLATGAPLTSCSIGGKDRMDRWETRVYSWRTSVTRTGDDEGADVSMLVRPARSVFGPGPRNDWQAVLYRPGSDRTQVRRSARFPRNSNSALRCGYWIKRMRGRVFRAVVPCTMPQSPIRLASRSCLDAILAELLPSELKTSPRIHFSQAEQA